MIEVIKVSDCTNNIGDYDVPIHNAIIIPPNATNGEVIRALFPNLYSYDGENYVLLDLSGFCRGKIEEKWWDAAYKVESEE